MFWYGIPEQGPRVFNCKFPCVCPCFVHKVIIAVPSIVIVDFNIPLKVLRCCLEVLYDNACT